MNRMMFNSFSVSIDYEAAAIKEIILPNGKNAVCGNIPLFEIKLRTKDGKHAVVTPDDMRFVSEKDGNACYVGRDIDAILRIRESQDRLLLRLDVKNKSDMLVEWVGLAEFGVHERLCDQTEGFGEIIYPYNEGCLVTDMDKCDGSWIKYYEPEYPSIGLYSVFPNMICSQFIAYSIDGWGIYVGLHDAERTTKHIDFEHKPGCIKLTARTFANTDYGQDYIMPFDYVMDFYCGEWQETCEIYRKWFEANKPEGVKKIDENKNLPKWYGDSPIVVTYPVRGHFDTDEMYENKLYPYKNALNELENIAAKTNSRVMALLMHWEGTAPWAPPYVWPPYGGEKQFTEFVRDAHEKGMLVGLYCSGIGWTQKSNIVTAYSREYEFENNDLKRIMCSDSDGRIEGKICTAQRIGYDMCPYCEETRRMVADEMGKISASDVDYVQAFDQNHGGNSYFCYSDKHGHNPAPGKWQAESVSRLLDEMRDKSRGDMLFGCESAGAEPFIGKLQFSDNRFELNYFIGTPIPIYSYIYHEYLNNFMGNQVCMELSHEKINYPYRAAYSFIAGDMLTAVIDDAGNIAYCWGNNSFSEHTDKDDALKILGNLNAWRVGAGMNYLHKGRMVKPMKIECDKNDFGIADFRHTPDKILTSAYEYEGKTVQFAVNYNKEDIEVNLPQTCNVYSDGSLEKPRIGVKSVKIPALSAVMIEIVN